MFTLWVILLSHVVGDDVLYMNCPTGSMSLRQFVVNAMRMTPLSFHLHTIKQIFKIPCYHFLRDLNRCVQFWGMERLYWVPFHLSWNTEHSICAVKERATRENSCQCGRFLFLKFCWTFCFQKKMWQHLFINAAQFISSEFVFISQSPVFPGPC